MDSNHDKVIQSHSLAAGQRTTIGSGANLQLVRPEDDKRSASDDQQVTKRSAESVPPRAEGSEGTRRRAALPQLRIRAERGQFGGTRVGDES
jgi:hypothetical protein